MSFISASSANTVDHEQIVIVGRAVQLVNDYHDIEYETRNDHQNKKANELRLQALAKELEIIGETAAFFGGYRAMLELNHAIIEAGGHSATLNEMWWGICGWAP